MKHGGDRHIDIIDMNPALVCCAGEAYSHTQGVQHNLTLTEIHALRISRGPGGVKGRGPDVFVKIRRIDLYRCTAQQVFILVIEFSLS